MKNPRLPFPRRLRFVRREIVGRVIEDRHLRQQDVAGLLGVCRNQWSQLFNGHRPLTPRMRLALLACPAFEGLAESDLWVTVEAPPKEAA